MTLLVVGYTPEEKLHALTEKENDRSVFAGFMGTPPPFTDEEIFGGATRRLLSGVDFRFLTASWENKLYALAKALAANGQEARAPGEDGDFRA